jgi:hypothetical protein
MKVQRVRFGRTHLRLRRWEPYQGEGRLVRPARLDGEWRVGLEVKYLPYQSLPPSQIVTLHLGWWKLTVALEDHDAQRYEG